MALQVLDFRLVALGTVLNIGTTDSMLISRTGIAMSTSGGSAVLGTGSNQWVWVEGVLAGAVGVLLGDQPDIDVHQRVIVAGTGFVTGTAIAISLQANNSLVTNNGLIDGGDYGVYFGGLGSFGSRLENHGFIHSDFKAVFSGGGEKLTIINTGTISATFLAISGSALDDSLRNTGQIFGDVSLLSGNDSYDGRGGTVEGQIFGGLGSDTFRLGDAIEIIDGGDGTDTLDFTNGGAIKVALDSSFANTKAATDDQYLHVEVVIGSRLGNDSLAGDTGANQLRGQGGNDTLLGRDGDDLLTGGTGADKLTGGSGNDQFIYNATTEGGDTITDFSNAALDDDMFIILLAGFGGGLPQGALSAFQFQSRADTVAQDADDRFIFNTATHTLWFDVNGNGAGGLTQLATLQASVVLTSADIFLA